jgi:hypothetical protein
MGNAVLKQSNSAYNRGMALTPTFQIISQYPKIPVEDDKDHKYFYFCYNGKPSAIHTKFSHSANEVDDNLIH